MCGWENYERIKLQVDFLGNEHVNALIQNLGKVGNSILQPGLLGFLGFLLFAFAKFKLAEFCWGIWKLI